MAKASKPAGGATAAEPEKPQAAAAATGETETPAAPSAEEVAAQSEELLATLAFAPTNSVINAKIQSDRENEEAPADEAVAEEAPEKDTETPEQQEQESEETPEAPAKPATEQRFVPGSPTLQEVEATARRAAEEVLEQRDAEEPDGEATPEKPGKPIIEDESLSDAAKDQLVVIEEMARLNPAFKELPARQRKFLKMEEDYVARWQQANPGVTYDPQAQEHANFYRQHEPFVPQREFKAAEKSLFTREAVREAEERTLERVRKEQEPRLRAIELREREREAAPAIAAAMADAAEAVFSGAPQFSEMFKPKELTKAAMEKMEAINPVLARLARVEAERTVALVNEIERLDRLKAAVDVKKRHTLSTGEVIFPQAALEVEFADCEQTLLAKPESERVRGGKKMISFADASARADRIERDPKLTDAQRQRAFENLQNGFWWVQPSDVREHIIAKSKARVGQYAECFPKTTTGVTETTAPDGAPRGQPAAGPSGNGKPPVKSSGKAGLPRGTATSSVSDTADNTPKAKSEREKAEEMLERAAFR